MQCKRRLVIVTVGSVIVCVVKRKSAIVELDDVRRQVVQSRRPLGAQRLCCADDHVAVMQTLLVAVDGQQPGARAGVGEYGVLAAQRRGVVDVPLLPQRSLATAATLADEPLRRQDAVDQRHERRVDVHLVEPVLELPPADRMRREPPRTDDLPYMYNRRIDNKLCLVYRTTVNNRTFILRLFSFPLPYYVHLLKHIRQTVHNAQ